MSWFIFSSLVLQEKEEYWRRTELKKNKEERPRNDRVRSWNGRNRSGGKINRLW